MSQVSPGAATAPGSAAALFRHTPFLLFFTARACSRFCYQIGAVAVGWQVYALTSSALDLGLIGLTQFVPMALLVFVAGHAADRFDRRRVTQMSQIAAAATAAFLAYRSFSGLDRRAGDFRRGRGARHDRGVRKPDHRGHAAAGGAGRDAATGDRGVERHRSGRDHHRPGARRPRLCGVARRAVRDYRRRLARRRRGQRRDPARRPSRRGPSHRRSPRCSPASDLFAAIR